MTDEREHEYGRQWFPGFCGGGESWLTELLTGSGKSLAGVSGGWRVHGEDFSISPLIQSFCAIYGRYCERVRFSCSFLTASFTQIQLCFQSKCSNVPREKAQRVRMELCSANGRSLGEDDRGRKNNACGWKKARKQKSKQAGKHARKCKAEGRREKRRREGI